ncbi:MAG: hypothetical protein ABSE70_10350 [Candidatus Limnocylindrales bacterium]
MFGRFDGNPVQSLPLMVVTAQLIIQGTIQTRLRRLTDVLNEPDVAHLLLLEATFMEVGSRRVVAAAPVGQVQLADVLFVHTTGPSSSSSEMRMPKQAVRATLMAPPFTIEGQIHLSYESELRFALDAYEGRFVPVTSARYWAYGVAESPNFVDLLAVNHARAHVAVAGDMPWRTEAPDEGPGSAPNPW